MRTDDRHRWAFELCTRAVARVFGSQPVSVTIFAQAVGALESNYGRGWQGAGKGSHNWGAIQHRSPPCVPSLPAAAGRPGCFPYEDSRPNAHGGSTKYAVCFRSWATDEEGVLALVHTVYSPGRHNALVAARNHNVDAFSAALYDSGYYQGFGQSREVRIANHARRFRQLVEEIENALGLPKPTPRANLPIWIGTTAVSVWLIGFFAKVHTNTRRFTG